MQTKAYHNQHVRLHRQRLRAAIIAYLGGKCAKCGHEDPRVLEVDHIHQAKEPRNHYLRSGTGLWRAILKGYKPLTEFQLLCCNCNFIKKLENKEMYRSTRA